MATHFSILVWKIPWTEEPGRLQSMRSQSQTRLSDYRTNGSLAPFCRRKSKERKKKYICSLGVREEGANKNELEF